MSYTLCWNCSHQYPETFAICPVCASTNANVDLKTALVEMNQKRQDEERKARRPA